MFSGFELLMVVLALGVLAVGLARRWRLPASKRPAGQKADWPALLAAIFGQKKIMARPWLGAAHLCLVYGFVIFLLIVILAQTPLSLPYPAARVVSLILDIAGLLMLAATLFMLIRRIIRLHAGKDARPPQRSLLPLALLLGVLLSGFCAEGARLSLAPCGDLWAAPLGAFFSWLTPASPLFMQIVLGLHFVLVLLLVALVPFSFMRHAASTSLHLLHPNQEPAGLPSPVNLEQGPWGAGTVRDLNAWQLREAEACTSCGRCDEQCPALISGKPLSPRSLMGQINDQMTACPHNGNGGSLPSLAQMITPEAIWSCTTCLACLAACPVNIRPLDKIIELRRNLVMQKGSLPGEAAGMLRNLELYGDVNGKGPAHKADWAFNRQVPRAAASSPPEVLLWVGCSGAFHPAYQQTTRDLVKLLKAGGVDFAILGPEEFCCGDPARKLGDEELFLKLAKRNMERLATHGIAKVVTLCPHCFNTLSKEYQALGCHLEVMPAVSLVEELVRGGRINLKYPLTKSLAVHDPCYLGRYNGIYEPLRQVCRSIPGVCLKELERNREQGFCCGGGGGRMWLHETSGENINVLRAREVTASGVDTVVTACPYCLTMLEDGVKTVDGEAIPQVKDVISLAADSLGENRTEKP